MYREYFSCSEEPFSITPDPHFFLNELSHRSALNTLLLALRHSEGFIKIVGEVGTGKSLLCRTLLARLGGDFVSIYIPNPSLNPGELRSFIASEIDAKVHDNMPAHDMMSAIYRRLLQLQRKGRQVVVIVDEVQAMPRDTIESLRLLTNLETEKRKLLQVVIMGQPELDSVLSRNDLRQLKQRIVFSEYLHPFVSKSVHNYLVHRLRKAGCMEPVFGKGASWLIHKGSGGIPRLINILAHKALMVAYGQGCKRVTIVHVARAIADTQESNWFGKFCAWNCCWSWP